MEKELGTIKIIKSDNGIRLEIDGLRDKSGGSCCCVVVKDGKTSDSTDCCKTKETP